MVTAMVDYCLQGKSVCNGGKREGFYVLITVFNNAILFSDLQICRHERDVRTHKAHYCINMPDLKTPKISCFGVFMYFIFRDVLKPALYGPQSCTWLRGLRKHEDTSEFIKIPIKLLVTWEVGFYLYLFILIFSSVPKPASRQYHNPNNEKWILKINCKIYKLCLSWK